VFAELVLARARRLRTTELRRIMSVTGCRRVSDIDSAVLVARRYFIGR
jgi:isopentenyl diphosphate isomerase/L-lactate dehydrogenase-like FMN-dependent dehydrogenase